MPQKKLLSLSFTLCFRRQKRKSAERSPPPPSRSRSLRVRTNRSTSKTEQGSLRDRIEIVFLLFFFPFFSKRNGKVFRGKRTDSNTSIRLGVKSITTVELKKQIATDLTVHNPTGSDQAFKVKTTAPKKYCVKPNTGIVPAGATTVVTVIMQAQREVPTDLENCRDKFLVQNTKAEKGESDDVPSLFTKEGKKIQETKLRVVFTEAGGLPASVPEDSATDGDGAPLSRFYSTKQSQSSQSVGNTQRPNSDKMASLEAQMQTMQKRNRQLQTELSKSMKPSAKGVPFVMVVLVTLLSFLVGMYVSKK